MEKVKSTLILCYGYVAMYAPKELVLSRIEADILKNIFQYFNTKVSCWGGSSWGGRAHLGELEQPGCSGCSARRISLGPVGTPWEKVIHCGVCSLLHC